MPSGNRFTTGWPAVDRSIIGGYPQGLTIVTGEDAVIETFLDVSAAHHGKDSILIHSDVGAQTVMAVADSFPKAKILFFVRGEEPAALPLTAEVVGRLDTLASSRGIAIVVTEFEDTSGVLVPYEAWDIAEGRHVREHDKIRGKSKYPKCFSSRSPSLQLVIHSIHDGSMTVLQYPFLYRTECALVKANEVPQETIMSRVREPLAPLPLQPLTGLEVAAIQLDGRHPIIEARLREYLRMIALHFYPILGKKTDDIIQQRLLE